MKIYPLLVLLFVCAILTRCKTEDIKPEDPAAKATSLIVGKWNLVKDSTASRFMDTGLHISEYIGTADDYYYFKDNGICYIKENGVYSTMVYKMTADNGVIFGDGNYPSAIDPLTSHSAKINVATAQNPGGGYFSKTVFLKK